MLPRFLLQGLLLWLPLAVCLPLRRRLRSLSMSGGGGALGSDVSLPVLGIYLLEVRRSRLCLRPMHAMLSRPAISGHSPPPPSPPTSPSQKLALDAYYTWLADLSEQMDRKTVEQAAALRSCLQVQRASLVELYSKTAVDQLVLARCCEQLLEERSPLSAPAQQWMVYMEGQLGSVPGTADLVMAAKSQS